MGHPSWSMQLLSNTSIAWSKEGAIDNIIKRNRVFWCTHSKFRGKENERGLLWSEYESSYGLFFHGVRGKTFSDIIICMKSKYTCTEKSSILYWVTSRWKSLPYYILGLLFKLINMENMESGFFETNSLKSTDRFVM